MSKFLTITIFVLSSTTFAFSSEREFDRFYPENKDTKVIKNRYLIKWEGVIEELKGNSNIDFHNLKFVRSSDGKEFEVTDSSALTRFYCNKSKKLLVKVYGFLPNQKSNKIVVSSFKVLEELVDTPHRHLSKDQKTKGYNNTKTPIDRF